MGWSFTIYVKDCTRWYLGKFVQIEDTRVRADKAEEEFKIHPCPIACTPFNRARRRFGKFQFGRTWGVVVTLGSLEMEIGGVRWFLPRGKHRSSWGTFHPVCWYAEGRFPPGHLLILSVYTEHLTGRAQTHSFSLSVSHRTHAHSAWLKQKVYPVYKVRFILAPISISFLDVGRPVRPLPLSAFLSNRLVMNPISPTSSATWTRSTRWSTSLTATAISCAQTTSPWFPALKVCRTREHPAAASTPQQEEFHRCSDFPSFRKLWQVMCRVVLALGNKVQFLTNLLQQWFLVHSRKGKEIETHTLCVRWKTEKISKRSLNGKLTRPFEERE